ncbi:hypothetical protein HJC23_013753 [Cyclotella cryptica]|uniref:Feruloyl esterase n=1 Tax=Cyclotella cryptica TaxID=29204 RepID=A0ABD3PIU4_9STRA|eukprot:CCRYP_014440-RA/>CCRYP_014440-RA protein AED:0.01 eAED:0.01 QI:367/1/1/1/0.5/0.33/3/2485/552
MVRLPKCSVLHAREVQIPNCKDAPEHCNRIYHLSLPNILCSDDGDKKRRLPDDNITGTSYNDDKFFDGKYNHVGTIPMVFALHGLGTDHRPLDGYAETADDYNFALILPEGVNQSFNAGDCCGDAHKLGIHDVEFLYQIQHLLSNEFDFVQPELSYGIGWDNGGLLLTDASIESPHLFKAIVPIAGYSTRTWVPPSVGTGIGIMMHHSLDDLIIRPSGCCEDPNMPACQGDLVSKSCDSVLESFDLWARSVNSCTSDVDERTPSGTTTLLVGGADEAFYSIEQEDGVTSMAFISVANEQDQEPSSVLFDTKVPLSISYKRDGVVCLATASSSCVANSTLCLYKKMGHFDGFVSTPFMGDQVMEFLARDACGTNGGSWKRLPRTSDSSHRMFCECSGNEHSGLFCLDAAVEPSLFAGPSIAEISQPGIPRLVYVAFGFVVVFYVTFLFVMRKLCTKHDGDFPATIHDDMCAGSTPIDSHNSSMPKNQGQLYWVKTKFESSIPRGRVRKLWNDREKIPTTDDHDANDRSDCSHSSDMSQSSLDHNDTLLFQLYE